jgi:hypothetical protein
MHSYSYVKKRNISALRKLKTDDTAHQVKQQLTLDCQNELVWVWYALDLSQQIESSELRKLKSMLRHQWTAM